MDQEATAVVGKDVDGDDRLASSKKSKSKGSYKRRATCAVAACNSPIDPGVIVYHRFPKDPEVADQWYKACRRADRFNFSVAVVCSNHFTAEDYVRDIRNELLGLPIRKARHLKENAVPSLNLFPSKPARKTAGSRQVGRGLKRKGARRGASSNDLDKLALSSKGEKNPKRVKREVKVEEEAFSITEKGQKVPPKFRSDKMRFISRRFVFSFIFFAEFETDSYKALLALVKEKQGEIDLLRKHCKELEETVKRYELKKGLNVPKRKPEAISLDDS